MIFSTFRKFSVPFATMMMSLYCVCFFFAIVGQYLYAGKINTLSVQEPTGVNYMYYLMNFNDFLASMITLFHILVINNWNQTTDMYCFVLKSDWPRVFFGAFWVLTVLIMLNIVISFVLETYSTTSEAVEASHTMKYNASQIS